MGAKRELLKRYVQTWRHAWRKREEMKSTPKLNHELEFLPAALSIQDTPPHPLPRYFQWLILAFAVIAILWACIGEIDVVATAEGKVIANGKSKVIQSSEVAVVKNIFVEDGQAVKKGEMLVQLDSQITQAEVDRIKNDLWSAQIDRIRSTAMLEAMSSQIPPSSLGEQMLHAPELEEATELQKQGAKRWVEGQYQELTNQLQQVSSSIDQRSAEMASTQKTILNLQKSMPIAKQLSEDYKGMLDKKMLGKHAWLQKEQERLSMERELLNQQGNLQQLKAAKNEAEQTREGVLAQTRRAMLDLQQQSAQKLAGLEQELKKAKQNDNLMNLTAPVEGTVQQLAIHTAGGVVTEAQNLMVIVPKDQPIEVEAFVENKDIGFVKSGQNVEVKVDTFNFTKYGVIEGKVQSLSSDAIEDEKRGLIYSTIIKLAKYDIQVGSTTTQLTPGMSVKVEIKTDKRKVIDYFLSPLKEYVSESIEER